VKIEDPALQLQMLGHLAENPEAMKQIVNLVNQEMIMSTMQDSDQMQMMEDMMADMMERMQTDPELEQAMMEHMDRMKLSRDVMMGTDDSMMNDMMDTKTDSPSCTSDWYITGYFLPLESDYSGKSVEISVDRTKQFYLADFLEFVKIEGWGRTNAGNYLGWYHGAFTISDRYLDAYDNDLIVGMVAVDNSVIEHGSELTIPTLPEPWNDMVFSGSDEGPSIIGKHIDVFTGEGIDAENETFRITGYNNQVCVQN
ncbi:MAG: 3D domain-containing protein, partial [Nitrosopumilus sp.]